MERATRQGISENTLEVMPHDSSWISVCIACPSFGVKIVHLDLFDILQYS